MNINEQLSAAIMIASIAHDGQFDKGGKPYILHPLHLMNQMLFDIELATIAVMHDVIEGSNRTIRHCIERGFSDRVVSALDLLTHKEGDSYDEYIDKICTNYDAIRVKRKDLQHDSDITRMKGLRERDFERLEKYHRAFVKLGEAKAKFEAGL